MRTVFLLCILAAAGCQECEREARVYEDRRILAVHHSAEYRNRYSVVTEHTTTGERGNYEIIGKPTCVPGDLVYIQCYERGSRFSRYDVVIKKKADRELDRSSRNDD